MDDGKPAWSDEFGETLIGSLVLVGLTHRAPDGDVLEQFYGTVIDATAAGVRLQLGGSREGETYDLPPDPRAFESAAPGTYTLRHSREQVVDPDFISTWTIKPPAN